MNSILFGVFTVITAGCCAYAWFKGQFAERSAAATLAIGTLVATMVMALLPQAHSSGVVLVMDALLGIYFVHLAMRYGKFWIFGELVMMTVQFALQTAFVMHAIEHNRFALGNNLVTAGTLALLAIGTYQSSTGVAGPKGGSVRSAA